ncbi:hypothetical protein RND71_016297 [Anisodus tanguticus]|uniref:Uncharacterized protein n=1 Tax=Anisodus tanguticus TaxID=243964 RepID=A0AAE1S885_9SOLA|nr:hypothetical protein RND71_016297 [Anisodus tanguticus]
MLEKKRVTFFSRYTNDGYEQTQRAHMPHVIISFVFLPQYSHVSRVLATIFTCHTALIGRHRTFPVTHKAAERWLHHMQQALDSAADIDEDSKT